MPNDPQNPQQPAPPADGGEPATVTRDEFQKVAALTNGLGARLRTDTDAMTKRLAAMEEAFKTFAEASKPKAPEPANGDKPDPRLAAAETRIKEMETRLEDERRQREGVEQARMAQERKTALSSALSARGITGPLLKAAMATIYDAEGRVIHDDKGNVGLKFTRKTTAGDYDEVVPIDSGLDELFKQEDYRIFLPPRPVQGAGTSPGKPLVGKPTKEQEKAAAINMLLPALLARG